MGARDRGVAARAGDRAFVRTATVPDVAARAGIVGAGFIGAVHARSARLAGARVAGVAASSPESSRAAAERLRAERAFDTPNNLHAELAALALSHGKHVVCEKPLATSAGQADELLAAAGAAGTVAT